jgi:hypothetical protein
MEVSIGDGGSGGEVYDIADGFPCAYWVKLADMVVWVGIHIHGYLGVKYEVSKIMGQHLGMMAKCIFWENIVNFCFWIFGGCLVLLLEML